MNYYLKLERFWIVGNILVVDDDIELCSMLVQKLTSIGHRATYSLSLSEGLQLAQKGDFDIVFLDVQFPEGNGLTQLSHFSSANSCPEVIVMTGSGELRGAEIAIKTGAWSYIEKPHLTRDLILPLTRALEYRKEKQRTGTNTVVLKRGNIIGESQAITSCLDQVASAATADANVLITGETGTGKELFAKAIHENSTRCDKSFITIDCASLPETLIESTLFGYTKGSFTGAEKAGRGLIHLAEGGTLFLDEVGELPFDVQKKFLRVIQEGRYRPIGSTTEVYSNFRVVSATNRDLEQMVKDGSFRADLLYRLRSFHIGLPPLRKRKEDIPALARFIVTRLCDRLRIEQKTLSSEFTEHLLTQQWLGNVRELQQLLEEVCAKAYQHQTLFACHLPENLRITQTQQKLKKKPTDHEKNRNLASQVKIPLSWKEQKAVMEKEYITDLMNYSDNNIQQACEISGISRARIYQLLKKQR